MSIDAAFRAEWYRWWCSRGAWLTFLLPALTGGLWIVGAGRRGSPSDSATGLGFGYLADGLEFGGAMGVIALSLMAALNVVRDRESGSLGLSYVANSRGKSLLGRALALLLAVLTVELVLFATCTTTAWLCHGLEPVVEDGFEMATTNELWTSVLATTAATIPVVMAAAMFGLLASVTARSVGAAVILTMSLLFLGRFAQGIHPRLFTAQLPFFGPDSVAHQLRDVARAYSDAILLPKDLWQTALDGGIGTVVLLALGFTWVRARRGSV